MYLVYLNIIYIKERKKSVSQDCREMLELLYNLKVKWSAHLNNYYKYYNMCLSVSGEDLEDY